MHGSREASGPEALPRRTAPVAPAFGSPRGESHRRLGQEQPTLSRGGLAARAVDRGGPACRAPPFGEADVGRRAAPGPLGEGPALRPRVYSGAVTRLGTSTSAGRTASISSHHAASLGSIRRSNRSVVPPYSSAPAGVDRLRAPSRPTSRRLGIRASFALPHGLEIFQGIRRAQCSRPGATACSSPTEPASSARLHGRG